MSWKSEITIPILSNLSSVVIRTVRQTKVVRILAYHRILPPQENFYFDDGVISASPEDFERQIKYFKRWYSIISFEYLKHVAEGNAILPRNPLIITFDDGYRDNYQFAFPILKRHSVPATVFLAVDYIGTNKQFWWDEVVFSLKKRGLGKEAIRQQLRELKRMDDVNRLLALADMRKIHSIGFNERMTLSWNEIREMSQGGMEFGSHTMTHPVLSRVNDKNKLRYEIFDSKLLIEQQLGKKIHAFSYPVGGRDALNDHIKQLIKEAGYSFAVTYSHGVNDFKDKNIDLFNLYRLDMDQEPIGRLRVKLLWPSLFRR